MISFGGRLITVRIAGEVFDPLGRDQPAVLTSWPTLGGVRAGLTVQQYDVGAAAGHQYPGLPGRAEPSTWGSSFEVHVPANDPFYNTLIALISHADAAAGGGRRAGRAQYGGAEHQGTGARAWRVQGGRDDAAAAARDGHVLGRRGRAGRRASWPSRPASALHASILRVMASAAGTGLPGSYVSVFRAPELLAAGPVGPGHRDSRGAAPGVLGGAGQHRVRAARRVGRRPAPDRRCMGWDAIRKGFSRRPGRLAAPLHPRSLPRLHGATTPIPQTRGAHRLPAPGLHGDRGDPQDRKR